MAVLLLSHINRGMWFTVREEKMWTESIALDLLILPQVTRLLDNLESCVVSKSRIKGSDSLITIKLGEESVKLELIWGGSGQTIGVNMVGPGDPTIWTLRKDGKIYRYSYWYNQDSDPRFKALEKLVRSLPLSEGPIERQQLKKSGGKYYIGSTGTGSALFCPHGIQISSDIDFRANDHHFGRDRIELLDHEWIWSIRLDQLCHLGCKKITNDSPIKAEAVWVCGGSTLQHKYGVRRGIVPIEEVKAQMKRREEEVSKYEYFGSLSCSTKQPTRFAYLTKPGSEKPGIFLVNGNETKFIPGPIEVVMVGTAYLSDHRDLINKQDLIVGHSSMLNNHSDLFHVKAKTNRKYHDIVEAGMLERELRALK